MGAMYKQRRDIISAGTTLTTGGIVLPSMEHVPENLAVSEFCTAHIFARNINIAFLAHHNIFCNSTKMKDTIHSELLSFRIRIPRLSYLIDSINGIRMQI